MTAAHPSAAAHTAQEFRVGTRASPLALIQTRDFIARITEATSGLATPAVFLEHHIRTTGDAVQDRKLAEIGGKGLFAKEIHEAMRDGRIDLAVHSLKDLETALPDGIVLACTLKREDARDALILGPACTAPDPADPFACLPAGATIGTSSVRRQAQLLHARPDLNIALLRGNVATRLARTENGDFAASLLALAGLRRLGLEAHAGLVLDQEAMVPSACQGIVGITARAADTDLLQLLLGIQDAESRAAATAERTMLALLDGSCNTPIGGYARLLPDGTLHMTGLVASADGSFVLKRSLTGAPEDAARIGAELGAELRRDCPETLFA
jgi:hydroxymethylbilane synthase